MPNFITSARVDVQNGLLVGDVVFLRGLNFISGENGTLKTKLLQTIKGHAQLSLDQPGVPCRLQAISPKRNAQRRAFQQVFTELRRQNTKLEGLINERNINDGEFEQYPAIGDLFYVVYEALCRDGGDQTLHMHEAETTFNEVVSRIFPQYKLEATWGKTTGTPAIEIVKHGSTRVPLEGLSLGEQEILSLALNISTSRDRFDVFLIDEPEVHLNWHLEDKLFEFFDDFCERQGRQMIIVTHSRAIFAPRYYPKTQFLYWDSDGRVKVTKDATPDQRRRIAGDAIEIIQFGALTKPTIFVEDDRHALIVEELSSAMGVEVSVSLTGNKANLRSLYRFSVSNTGLDKCLFVEDGDNEGNPFPGSTNFIHLAKYCLETYLLDVPTAAAATGRSQEGTRQALLNAIRAKRDVIFKKNRFFEFLVDQLRAEHLTESNLGKLDASELLEAFLDGTGKDLRSYVSTYVRSAMTAGCLAGVMPPDLVSALEALRAR